MISEADTDTTGMTFGRQREKTPNQSPTEELGSEGRHPCVCPFGNEECSGHSLCTWEGALLPIPREEWWRLMLP